MQRTRNVGYDDDDLYDDDYYEEEEEVMSADDKEQMRISTVSVREALGRPGPTSATRKYRRRCGTTTTTWARA